MTNYYDILGIRQEATLSEIKTAFRALAKLYHPDKNPSGREHFNKILKAYETLVNPTRKHSYDLKLKYHQSASASHATGSKTKKWTFEEKEMKRRQYYNEHIKKYEKVNKAKAEHAELKKNYNEYKYILFATPIAVALFLLVINFATPSRKTTLTNGTPEQIEKPSLNPADSPYSDYFGPEIFSRDNKNLRIKNQTGKDIILCLFSDNEFIRCCVILNGFFAEIPQLPAKKLSVRFVSGTKWDSNKKIYNGKVKGGFTEDVSYYQSRSSYETGTQNEITLTGGRDVDYKEISETEFFTIQEL